MEQFRNRVVIAGRVDSLLGLDSEDERPWKELVSRKNNKGP
jgi:hypothetical protein